MADELELHLLLPGRPPEVMAAWRASPPDALADFRLRDEAYNSLTYERRYYDWPQKLMFVTSLGFALLFKSFMGSTFRLTVRFDEGDPGRTRVTVSGTAHPRARRELGAFAEAQGGAVGLRVGV
ncbi:MAG TPA: hypothetical protein VF533_17825 [Solirubrobacteraceae bacterium]|jgi:hypothetical protein